MHKKIALVIPLLLLSIAIAYAITITPISTPTGTTSNASVLLSYNFSTDFNNQTFFSWDGTNYSLYDDSLVLFYNFDNRSALGENDSKVVDISKYSNNGTVIGGSNISWTPNGYYNGAYSYKGIGQGAYSGGIRVNNLSLNLTTTSTTICFWVNITGQGNSSVQHLVGKYGGSAPEWDIVYINSTNNFKFQTRNSTTTTGASLSGVIFNQWYYLCGQVDRDNSLVRLYSNGIFIDDDPLATGTLSNTLNIGIGASLATNPNTRPTNGTIDELKIWNRTLSSSEILQIYNSQLTKYDTQNWTFISNQNLNYNLNSSVVNHSFIYYLCSSNSTSEVCTSSQSINQVIANKNVNASFSTSTGNIRNDFYGTNGNLLSNLSWIDANFDGTLDTPSNFNQEITAFTNSKMNAMRINAEIDNLIPAQGIYNETANLSNFANALSRKNQVQWAYQNNVAILLDVIYTPSWIRNQSSPYCTASSFRSCPASNYTLYADTVRDLISYLTVNGTYPSIRYVEIGNEPYSTVWLNNLSTDNITKATEYVKMFNASYSSIKSLYPNIQVGGPSGSSITTSPNLYSTFISNQTGRFDFLSLHIYSDFNSNFYQTTFANISSLCSTYSANCSTLISSEFNSGLGTVLNSTDQTQNIMQNALYYSYMLNTYPRNMSNYYFSFSFEYSYNNANSFFLTHYDKKYEMFSESLLDNEYTGSFNATRNFATYCPSGGTVYSSSSDDATVKTVSCKLGNQYANILINTDTSSKNMTLNSSNTGYLMDKDTGTLYAPNTNSNLGIVDSYIIKYLVTPNFTLSESTWFTKSALTGESYTGTEVYISSDSQTRTTIISNLTVSVNATVSLTQDCVRISGISYTPAGGTTINYPSGSIQSTCNQFNNGGFDLPVGPGSNTFSFSYLSSSQAGLSDLCSAVLPTGTGFFGSIQIIFSIIAVAIIIGFLLLIVVALNVDSLTVNGNILELFDVRAVMIGLTGVGLIAYLIVMIFGALC